MSKIEKIKVFFCFSTNFYWSALDSSNWIYFYFFLLYTINYRIETNSLELYLFINLFFIFIAKFRYALFQMKLEKVYFVSLPNLQAEIEFIIFISSISQMHNLLKFITFFFPIILYKI